MRTSAFDRWITTEPAWRTGDDDQDEVEVEGMDELPDDIPDWWEADEA